MAKKKKKKKRSHAGFKPDCEPSGSADSELWFARSQTLIPTLRVPDPRCQLADLLCVSVAAAADASSRLFVVVSAHAVTRTRTSLPACNKTYKCCIGIFSIRRPPHTAPVLVGFY